MQGWEFRALSGRVGAGGNLGGGVGGLGTGTFVYSVCTAFGRSD